MRDFFKLIYYLMQPQSVLLRRFSNALGDNVLSSSLLTTMRARWSDHKIIVETVLQELFWNNPFVDWTTSKHIKTSRRHIKPKYCVIKGYKPSFTVQMNAYLGLKNRSKPILFLAQKKKEGQKSLSIFICYFLSGWKDKLKRQPQRMGPS